MMTFRILLSVSLLLFPLATFADEPPVFSNCFEEVVLSNACQATKNEIDILLEATFEEFLDEEGFTLDESHISKAQYYAFIALLMEIHPNPDVDGFSDAAYAVINNPYGEFRQSTFDYMMGTEDRQESLVPLERYAHIIPEHFQGIFEATQSVLIAQADAAAARADAAAAQTDAATARARAVALIAAFCALSGNSAEGCE